MAIQQRREPTNIYLTFKVFQLVNQLRRRLKPRVVSGPSKQSLLGSASCLGLGSKALHGIETTLSRASGLHDRKQWHHSTKNRVCKPRKGLRPSSKLQTSAKNHAADPNASGDEIKLKHMLKSLDDNPSHPDNALSIIASNEKLFVERNADPNFDGCSLNEIISYLLLVHDGINVLYAARSQHDDQWLISQGGDIGLNIDEVFIANYEHLLLSLRGQLIDALTRKVVEALIEGNHDKTQRKLLGWFAEFPNNRHPLNTTWPWSIKPSLAVLWGVCWMFYNSPAQQAPDGDNSRVSRTRFLPEVSGQWNAPSPNDYYYFGLELTANADPQLQAQQQLGGGVGSASDLRQEVAGWPRPANQMGRNLSGHVGAFAMQPALLARAQPHSARNRPSRTQAASGLAPDRHQGPILGTPTTASAFAQGQDPALHAQLCDYNNYASASHASAQSNIFAQDTFTPAISGIATQPPITAFPVLPQHLDPNDQPWPSQLYLQQPASLPQRPGSQSHLTVPNIRVNDDNQASAGNAGFTTPQQPDFSSFNLYNQAHSQAQQAQQHQLNNAQIRLNTQIPPNIANSPYNMGNFGVEQSPISTQQRPRTPSNANSNMPTPVSISAPRSPLRSPIDDRRRSVASSIGHVRHSSGCSVSSQEDNDELSSRRNHSYKRSEEPPKNKDGEMICKHSECGNITFQRKCEWSKHMDKHDRPYKCNVKGCEKLQGFTYSGGLLRHEREVHKMHGGTKKALFCPFADCKRSSGAGFTRKENLAEHVRRVHRRTSMSVDLGSMVIARQNSRDNASPAPHPADDYHRTIIETQEENDPFLNLKRKRMSDAGFSEEGDSSDLRSEVKRLRAENEEKDERLRQLEAAVMALQQGRR